MWSATGQIIRIKSRFIFVTKMQSLRSKCKCLICTCLELNWWALFVLPCLLPTIASLWCYFPLRLYLFFLKNVLLFAICMYFRSGATLASAGIRPRTAISATFTCAQPTSGYRRWTRARGVWAPKRSNILRSTYSCLCQCDIPAYASVTV